MKPAKSFLQSLLRAAEDVLRFQQARPSASNAASDKCASPEAKRQAERQAERGLPVSQAANTNSMSSIAVFDSASALQRLRGNPALLKHLIVAFLEDLPGELHDIRHAAETADLASVRAASHRLKGAAMTLSADPLMRAAAMLERLALHESADAKRDDMQAMLRDLEARATELKRELQAFLER